MTDPKRKDVILPFSFFLLTVLTRIPFTSKLLYHMDSVQFALALENYNITIHQPHPPGYFLYVMLGRLIDYFVNDANTTFVSMSIFFSGLTVVVIYYLGTEMFDRRTGVFAALIALTSPNVWFHGEVALTYIVEAFFSSFVALLCWRILKGEHKYIWLSVIALGIAGGIRQNTVVFLLPLWLFSVKKVPLRSIIPALALLGIVCLAWFVPMMWMTGGLKTYHEALSELWEFNTGHLSVFERGWEAFQIYGNSVLRFIIYGLGAGIFILGIGLYSVIRHGRIYALDKQKMLFLLLWVIPSLLFYLLIFIHPANPGYVLILLPAFFMVTAIAIQYINILGTVLNRNIGIIITLITITINTSLFVSSKFPITHREIKIHDNNLSILINTIKSFDPLTTGVFAKPFIFYSYRHIMYYVPECYAYQIDIRITRNGKSRKIFWGKNKTTFLSDEVTLPGKMRSMLLLTDIQMKNRNFDTMNFVNKLPNTNIHILLADINILQNFYPALKINKEVSLDF